MLLTSTRASFKVLMQAVLCLDSIIDGVSRGFDGGGSVSRWLEENETIEHLQALILEVAQGQVGIKKAPGKGHRQRGGLLLPLLLYIEGDHQDSTV